jgi:group I intron endonuclease
MDRRLGEIYLITNKVNGKQYVGQAVCYSGKLKKQKHGTYGRWKMHVRNALNNVRDSLLLDRAIRKYGEDNFLVEDILTCYLDVIDSQEISKISQYNTLHPNGYNIRNGGNHGGKHAESTKEKIGNAHLGRIVKENTREKISKTSKYRNISEENKKSIEEALKLLNMDELPMYIGLQIDRRNGRNVHYIRVNIPNIKPKKFAKKDMKLTEKIKLAIEYKNFVLQRSSVGEVVTTSMKA